MIINTTQSVPKQSVADFYDGKSVLITGGTGFIGKVFIAKLLQSCPKIRKLYLLIREKKGITAQKRFADIIENPLFSKLREHTPEAFEKVVPIHGDITVPDLAIPCAIEEELIQNVSIVFHVAASVKFTEPIRKSLKDNVEGTMHVLKLCQRMQKIELLVHMSTAYSNCREDVVEERLYPPPADLTDLYLRLKQMGDDGDTSKLLNGWPNTYTFCKALAENYLAKHHGRVPTIIVRPSIVTAILQDPLEGWIDNWNGATGVLIPIAKGINRIMLGCGSNLVDLIPVDYVVNLSIVAAASNKKPKDVVFYNICSTARNPITLKGVIDSFVEESIKKRDWLVPFPRLYYITRYKWLVSLVTVLLQIIPAYIVDAFRRLRGKRPFYVKLVNTLVKSRDTVEFFSAHTWVFKSDGVASLYNSLSRRDQEKFPCDPANIKWREYMAKYYDGVQRFLQKKKLEFYS